MKTTKHVAGLIIIFALAFLSTLESCSSSTSTVNNSESTEKFEMLSSKGWVLASAVKDMGVPEGELDLFFFMNESEKNDVLYFYPNSKTVKSTKVFKSGKIESHPLAMGEWTLAEGDSKLIISSGKEVTELVIETLNDSELVVSFVEYDEVLKKEVKSTFGYKS